MTNRDIDLLVAQHVFGRVPKKIAHREFFPEHLLKSQMPAHCRACDQRWDHATDIDGICPVAVDGGPFPAYSSTGDGMLAVIEQMLTLNWDASLSRTSMSPIWHAEFLRTHEVDPDEVYQRAESRDSSAPRTVAIAALRALGVEVES